MFDLVLKTNSLLQGRVERYTALGKYVESSNASQAGVSVMCAVGMQVWSGHNDGHVVVLDANTMSIDFSVMAHECAVIAITQARICIPVSQPLKTLEFMYWSGYREFVVGCVFVTVFVIVSAVTVADAFAGCCCCCYCWFSGSVGIISI